MKIWLIALCLLGSVTDAWAAPTIEVQSLDDINVQSLDDVGAKDQYLNANFGNVQVNFIATRAFSVTNTGNVPISFSRINISGFSFAARTNCPQTLFPQQRCITEVQFHPYQRGYDHGHLDFIFDQGGNIFVDLSGWGV